MVLTRGQFQRIFPAYEDFLAVKRRLDPDELFQSDLYRRLIRDAESGPAEAAPEIVVTAGETRPAYAGAKGEAVGNER